MKQNLGIDLGTNSIGWAIVEQHQDLQKHPSFELRHKGVHLFSEGVNRDTKGNTSSKAAERTRLRSARKIKYRRKLRKYITLKTLIEAGMCPLSHEELNAWRRQRDPETGKQTNFKKYPTNPTFLAWLNTDNDGDKSQRKSRTKNPYFYRDLLSRERLDLSQLPNKMIFGRAMYHLAQRRGFSTLRDDTGSESYLEQVKLEIGELASSVESNKDLRKAITEKIENGLVQWKEDDLILKILRELKKLSKSLEMRTLEDGRAEIAKILNKKENLGLVAGGIINLSERIKKAGCQTLGQYFYLEHTKAKRIRQQYIGREEHYEHEFKLICKVQQIDEQTVIRLYHAIFDQRELKSQKGLVGRCTFETNKPRCPISHPEFEEYRALQVINNIRLIQADGTTHPLSDEQRAKVWPLFLRKSKPTFSVLEIKEKLGSGTKINYRDLDTVSGCPTIAHFSFVFGPNWKEEIYQRYAKSKFSKLDSAKTESQVINDIWHVFFSFNKDREAKLQKWGKQNLDLTDELAKKFARYKASKDYAPLSLKAIRKITLFLKRKLIFSYAVFFANLEEVVGKQTWEDPTQQNKIIEGITLIIDSYKETKHLSMIVNNLIHAFRTNYANGGKDYSLDATDREEVLRQIKSEYGEKTFDQLHESARKEIINKVEALYEHQLQAGPNGLFLRIHRIDEEIQDFLRNQFGHHINLSKLYHPSDIELFKTPERNERGQLLLGSPISRSLKNPIAMRALHELRKLINTLIQKELIDEHTHVHIELARDLNDKNRRSAIERYDRERQAKRDTYEKAIIDLYQEQCGRKIEPSKSDILRYELWQEQNHICLYTGMSIGICDFIGPNPKFDIEHTVARSKSQDDSMENKTLAYKYFNEFIKGTRLPIDLPNFNKHATFPLDFGPRECPPILETIKHFQNEMDRFESLYKSRMRSKGIETPEQKDKRVAEKHYYKRHYDYWHGKYRRFIMKEITAGFKNSQLVDIGIISKYARAYLNSVFPSVRTIKGEMVAKFRQIWNLQPQFEAKKRDSHLHHCIDAVTLACITRENYDRLAAFYREGETRGLSAAKEFIKHTIPWPTFVSDMKLIESDVLVTRRNVDNIGKQAKKLLRKKGKIVLNQHKKPRIQSGDTFRNALHKDHFYGAILVPQSPTRDENQKIIYDSNGLPLFERNSGQKKYVIRKSVAEDAGLDRLSEKDIESIVDPSVKCIIENAIVASLGVSRQEYESVKDKPEGKKMREKGLKLAMSSTIWMNEAKGIKIRKVRCYAHLTEPLEIKAHRDTSSHEHKRRYFVLNEGNYALALYEKSLDNGEIDRQGILISYYEAAAKLKVRNMANGAISVPESEFREGYDFKAFIKKGMAVLLYDKHPEEFLLFSRSELAERLFRVVGIDKESSSIKLLFHQEARERKYIAHYMGLKKGEKGGKNIGKARQFPLIKVSPKQFDALLEGIDFKLDIDGTITFL